MKKFQLITKLNCPKCSELKDWLKKHDIPYEEWPIEDKKIVDKVLHDDKFIQTFCDIDGCMVYTPVIRIEETGKYYYKELFGITGIREDFIKSLLGL